MFLNDLEAAATQKCGLVRDQPILVGVSGGADSLALLHGLDSLGFELVIAHLDHAIREESSEDADYVQRLAETYNKPFVRKRVDVSASAMELGQSLEEAARNLRYQFLFEQARLEQAQAVAVAHHADDQVETVLMHLLRGAGLPGLSGMPYRKILPIWDPKIPLVRPLLGIWRDEINVYLHEVGLEPRIDWSNQDTTYFRNSLRHQLIPEMEKYNPRLREVIWRMADVLRAEDQLLEDQTATAWMVCLLSKSEGRVQLNRKAFLSQPFAIQRRLLRKCAEHLRPDLREVGFEAVERGIAFVREPPESGRIDWIARLDLALIADRLVVLTWDTKLPDGERPLLLSEGFQGELAPGQQLKLRHGWQLTAQILASHPEEPVLAVKDLDTGEAWFDLDRVKLPLIVRSRKPGDSWQPLGMEGHSQKLNDFFINRKIPAHLRKFWPLVCSGDEIIWVVGVRPADSAKITDNTRRILHLRLDHGQIDPD